MNQKWQILTFFVNKLVFESYNLNISVLHLLHWSSHNTTFFINCLLWEFFRVYTHTHTHTHTHKQTHTNERFIYLGREKLCNLLWGEYVGTYKRRWLFSFEVQKGQKNQLPYFFSFSFFSYRVSHSFRLAKRDDYFLVTLTTFKASIVFLRKQGQQ